MKLAIILLLFCNKFNYVHVRQLYKSINIRFYCSYGPHREKTCLRWFANNKGADQPAHLRRLISAFVVCVLENIPKLATSKFSFFKVVSEAEESRDWYESHFVRNPEDRFSRVKFHMTPKLLYKAFFLAKKQQKAYKCEIAVIT